MTADGNGPVARTRVVGSADLEAVLSQYKGAAVANNGDFIIVYPDDPVDPSTAVSRKKIEAVVRGDSPNADSAELHDSMGSELSGDFKREDFADK